MDYINYTKILGEELETLGFSKELFDNNERYMYKKRFKFGELRILDGSANRHESVNFSRFGRDDIDYIDKNPINIQELFELISEIAYKEGVISGEKSKIYEIRTALEL